MDYRTLNPATEELLQTYPGTKDSEAHSCVEQSIEAFRSCRKTEYRQRATLLQNLADHLESQSETLAELMALEMGKIRAEGIAEIAKCAWCCRHFARTGEEYIKDDPRGSDGSVSFARYEPLGPLLAIMPWNFPFWQFFRFAAPALLAGNSILLKHAPSTPRCAIAIEKIVRDAGFPGHLVQSLFLTNEQVATLIGNPHLRGVTLTGSTNAGRAVAESAGRHLKTMVLELGGSDPFIVLEDADLSEAIQVGVTSRCLNAGQSCIAAKRFLVHQSKLAEFSERFAEVMKKRVAGDPLDPRSDMGPLAREDLRDQLADQVAATVTRGATVLCGGKKPEGTGFYYPATVLLNADPGSPALSEELFGPVAVIVPFTNDREAIQLANATEYGLGASLWTQDLQRANHLLEDLETGNVFVNGMVKSDPRLPFGGAKASGFGRELSREGMREFVNIKTVWIK